MRAREIVPDWVVQTLRRGTGMDVIADHSRGVVELRSGKAREGFRVETRSRVSTPMAREIAGQWSAGRSLPPNRPLLATSRLAAPAREALRAAKVSWVERDTGVINVMGDRVLIRIEPKAPENLASPVHDQLRAADLRFDGLSGVVIEGLLTGRVDLSGFHLVEIAKSVGVTPSWAHYVVSRLLDAGLVTATGAGRWRTIAVPDRSALLDAWLEAGPEPKRSEAGLYVWAQTPGELHRALPRLSAAGVRYAVGGLAAANLRAPFLTVWPPLTLWIEAATPAEEIAGALEGEVVGDGANVTLWQVEKDAPLRLAEPVETVLGTLPMVSAPRSYVEAHHAPGRGEEVATHLREEMGY